MSLGVHLSVPEPTESRSGIFVRENGSIREISRAEWDEKFPGREPVTVTVNTGYVYSANITHNLGKMADMAYIYEALWRPEEIGIIHAYQLIEPLKTGLTILRENPDYFKNFNPENGWGNYDILVTFVEEYLAACEKYPQSDVLARR